MCTGSHPERDDGVAPGGGQPEGKCMSEQDDRAAVALARLQSDLATGTLLEIVLRGHLWIESEIIGGVTDQFPFPDQIDVARLTFPTKLSLAAAHGLIPSG